jgi:YD repeat-containing protein
VPAIQKSSYFRRRGWKDLIFIAVVLLLGYAVKLFLDANNPTDYKKWNARPKLNLASAHQPSQAGADPCLFLAPSDARNQAEASGSIGDCSELVPDGRELDVWEVKLWSGQFFRIKSDLHVQDTIPLAFTRTYNPFDPAAPANVPYLRHVYDLFLYGDRFPYTYLTWALPSGPNVLFKRISPGTRYADAVYEEAMPSPKFEGARIDWNGFGWDITLEDGTTYLSPDAYRAKRPQQGSLVGIFDNAGNEVRLSREENGDLAEIESPGGRSIRLTYKDGLVARVTDSTGNFVDYNYDSKGRPRGITDNQRQREEYTYDDGNRIATITASNGSKALENTYDTNGRLVWMSIADEKTYQLKYDIDEARQRGLVEITGPSGDVTRVSLEANPEQGKAFYSVESVPKSAARRKSPPAQSNVR